MPETGSRRGTRLLRRRDVRPLFADGPVGRRRGERLPRSLGVGWGRSRRGRGRLLLGDLLGFDGTNELVEALPLVDDRRLVEVGPPRNSLLQRLTGRAIDARARRRIARVRAIDRVADRCIQTRHACSRISASRHISTVTRYRLTGKTASLADAAVAGGLPPPARPGQQGRTRSFAPVGHRANWTRSGSKSRSLDHPMPLPDILKTDLRLPVVAAPLFIVSHPPLVLAQCKAGVVGSFPALNARPESQLDEWLAEITEELAAHGAAHPERPAAPFAVNQIVHRSNRRLEHDLEMCVRYKVPIVISSLGAVPEVNDAVHSYGGIVLHDIISIRHAHSAINKGADGLIAVAAGAGGHAGPLSPFALVQEIRSWFPGPLLLSGAIATGGAILAAEAMGADLAYIGSPFIATPEARAVDEYKRMIVESAAGDVVRSSYFTGIPGNYLKASISRAGMDPDNLPEADPSKMDFDDGGSKVKAWRDIWGAGQGIGAVTDAVPVAELVSRLEREYGEARRRLCARQRQA